MRMRMKMRQEEGRDGWRAGGRKEGKGFIIW
jgi:hypothetical protein